MNAILTRPHSASKVPDSPADMDPQAQASDLKVPRSKRRVWAAYIAFFTTVFASMAAAATVAASDFPLIVGGL